MLNQNILLLIASIVYLVFLVKNIRKKMSLIQIFIDTALYFYIVSVFCIVFFPFPFQQHLLSDLRSQPHQPQNNVLPFYDIYQIVSHDFLRDSIKQLGGNVFMLAPFGFLIPIAMRNVRFSKVLIMGFCFSVSIEIIQFILDMIIRYNYRTSDIDDVICNTVGVIVGFCIFKLANKYLGLSELAHPASGGNPDSIRVPTMGK